jgi:hypothetical protein
MNREHDDSAEHHAIEQAMQQEVEELIDEATKRPITNDEKAVLRWHCGLR